MPSSNLKSALTVAAVCGLIAAAVYPIVVVSRLRMTEAACCLFLNCVFTPIAPYLYSKSSCRRIAGQG